MLKLKRPAIPPDIITMETAAMATTINTYLKGVKLITASTLSALETAVNTYITGLDGEYATRVDVDITTVRDVPEPKTLYVATVEVVGTTTTE